MSRDGTSLHDGRSTADAGLLAIEEIRVLWQVDTPWSEPIERGFKWYPKNLCHELFASLPWREDGCELFRVSSRIKIVEDIRMDPEAAASWIGLANRYAATGAFYFERETASLWSLGSMIIHKDTLEWRPRYFSALALIQVEKAEREAGYLAEALEGHVAARAHSTSGLRPRADGILEVPVAVLVKPATDPNPFVSESEFHALEEICSKSEFATFGADPKGICAELEFGGDTALMTVSANLPHPQLGSGLFMSLQLPGSRSMHQCAISAGFFNQQEAIAGRQTHLQGAWCINNRGKDLMIAYTAFRPNGCYRHGIIQDEFYGLARRALWIRRQLVSESHEAGDAWHIVRGRMGYENT